MPSLSLSQTASVAHFPGGYLIALIISIGCLLLIDSRAKLAFFLSPKRTAATLLVGVSLFLIWDLVGVTIGIFFEGNSGLLLGLNIYPQVPIEEPVFLFLLCYTILLGYLGASRFGKAKVDKK